MTINITNEPSNSTYFIYANSTIELSVNTSDILTKYATVFYDIDTFQVMDQSSTDNPEEEITYTYYRKGLYLRLQNNNIFSIIATLEKKFSIDDEYVEVNRNYFSSENIEPHNEIKILLYVNTNNIKVKYQQNNITKEFECNIDLFNSDDRLSNYNFCYFNSPIIFDTYNNLESITVNLNYFHQWFHTEITTFNTDSTLEQYVNKQLPMSDLVSWVPLYNNFLNVLNKTNNFIRPEIGNEQSIGSHSFLNNYLELNPQQSSYFFTTEAHKNNGSNTSFWFKLDTDYINWLVENTTNSQDLPDIELFTYKTGYYDTTGSNDYKLKFFYKALDDNDKNLIIKATGESSSQHQQVSLSLKKWYFINFAIDINTKKLYVTILPEGLSQNTIDIHAIHYSGFNNKQSGCDTLYFGLESLVNRSLPPQYNGNILSISDLLYFQNNNFYLGNSLLHNINKQDNLYNLYMLYWLDRGKFSEQTYLFNRYLIHKTS